MRLCVRLFLHDLMADSVSVSASPLSWSRSIYIRLKNLYVLVAMRVVCLLLQVKERRAHVENP